MLVDRTVNLHISPLDLIKNIHIPQQLHTNSASQTTC